MCTMSLLPSDLGSQRHYQLFTPLQAVTVQVRWCERQKETAKYLGKQFICI